MTSQVAQLIGVSIMSFGDAEAQQHLTISIYSALNMYKAYVDTVRTESEVYLPRLSCFGHDYIDQIDSKHS